MRQNETFWPKEEIKQAGSAEDGSREDCEETKEVQMQPQSRPGRVLLRLQSFWKPLFPCPRQKERNLLSAIIVAPDQDTRHLDRSYVFKKLWNCCPCDSNGHNKKEVFSKPRCGSQESCWPTLEASLSGSEGRASACNVGDLGLIPGSGTSPGEGKGNPLRYSWLENPMDGEAW